MCIRDRTKEVHINEYGTDDYSRLVLTYPGGCKAESVQTIGQELERNARIVGTKGSIFLPDAQYLGYIDLRTLAILFSLMTVMAGLRRHD